MRIPLSWIKEYIDIELPPSQIGKILTMAGLEVEGMEPVERSFTKIVVATVIEVAKHPDADKLCVATVAVDEQTYSVVCGAPNCRPGLKTAFAPIGATLSDEEGHAFKIKRTKLRGVESEGMLCSGKELGLSEDAEGIIEFDAHIEEGAEVADLYADTVFEIALTPNLGHCASVVGVVRELSAVTGIPYRLPIYNVVVEKGKHAHVEVEESKLCPRYSCRIISGVNVKPSPHWMQDRLLSCGVRPINNIVDITNYVLLEMGQPLHGFDFEKIAGKKIMVRCAKEGETLVTLDEKERKLFSNDLLICDGEKPVALAGVMGGLNSEVSDKTVSVLLESACFDPKSVRRTSRRLALLSDASKRFEKGVDPNGVVEALNRAARLMQEIAGGKVGEVVDIFAGPFEEKEIECRLSRINKLLGTHLVLNEVEVIFQRLQFPYTWDGKDAFTVRVPTYRRDVHGEVDLIEEVARVNGYDKIPKGEVRFHPSPLPNVPIFVFEREIRSALISEGLQELLTCDLISPTIVEVLKESLMPEEAHVKVLNPTSIEQSVLRTSLLPGLLQVVKHNYDRQNQTVCGFEIGRIHFKDEENYKEQAMVGIVLSGNIQPHHFEAKTREVDFFDLKGIIQNLLEQLHVENSSFSKNNLNAFHSGRQATISVNGLEIGAMGEIHPSLLRHLDIPQRILFAELNLHDLLKVRQEEEKMEEVSSFPSSERDWTVTLDTKVPLDELIQSVRTLPSRLLESVSLLDIYKSDKLGVDKQNVTLRFVYRDKRKTVAQEAVEKEHTRLTHHVMETIQ